MHRPPAHRQGDACRHLDVAQQLQRALAQRRMRAEGEGVAVALGAAALAEVIAFPIGNA